MQRFMKTLHIEEPPKLCQSLKMDVELPFCLLSQDSKNLYFYAQSRQRSLEEEMFTLALETEEEESFQMSKTLEK